MMIMMMMKTFPDRRKMIVTELSPVNKVREVYPAFFIMMRYVDIASSFLNT